MTTPTDTVELSRALQTTRRIVLDYGNRHTTDIPLNRESESLGRIWHIHDGTLFVIVPGYDPPDRTIIRLPLTSVKQWFTDVRGVVVLCIG